MRAAQRIIAATVACAALAGPVRAAGFHWTSVPDPAGAPIEVGIWYPSEAPPTAQHFGPITLTAAYKGPLSPRRRPLIVMSHGTGGSALNSHDTAAALADAGFIVAAVTHNGDSFKDGSDSFSARAFTRRTAQMSLTIDGLLSRPPWAQAIDPDRIGMFGHSAGGTTALLLAGGVLDWSRIVASCKADAADWGCAMARNAGRTVPVGTAASVVAHAEPRIRAIAVAAPALAAGFAPDGLTAVSIPVQLWVSGQDKVVTDAAAIGPLLPQPPDEHRIAAAGHFAFLAPCGEKLAALAPDVCTDPPGFDRAAFLRTLQGDLIAYFKARLGSAP